LIYRYRQSSNLHIYNDFPPIDIFDFWISWLHQIQLNALPEAAGYRSAGYAKDYELRGPISELISAIEDLKSGVQTKYTEACFTKKKKGDRTDPPAVARHKQQIGLTCKLLTQIGFRTQANAVKRINRALKHAGMRHGYTLDSVKKWVKSVPDREWEITAKSYIRTLITCERNVLTNWDNLSDEERQMFHEVCNAPIDDLIPIWTSIIEMVIQRFPAYSSLARYKILRLWATHLRVHEGTWIASPIYKELYGRFGI
jgi:hypothetical protein